MPDTPLTLAAIQAMDDETLHLLIEEKVYGRTWTRYGEDEDANGDRLYKGIGVHGFPVYILSADLAHTRYWDKVMDLRQTHGQYIDLVWWGQVQRVRSMYGDCPFIDCTTEEEVRRAICQLVLWQTLARQAWDAEEAAAQERAVAEENRLAQS